ncbi:MAG: cell division protein ZapB, partial [Candidatus Zixiibacteriota bacterium]
FLKTRNSLFGFWIMQLENFERLEEKITKVIKVIDRLKQENQQISSSYSGLANQISQFEEKTKNLSLENERLKKELKEREGDFKQKEQKIRRKLEKLLQKLTFVENFD